MAESKQNAYVSEMYNAGYTGSSALEVRLKTDAIISELKQRFEGKILIFEGDTVKEMVIGEPLMNPLGIQNMLGLVASHINTGTVQGNFPTEVAYNKFMLRFHIKVIDAVFINTPEWGIKPNNQNLLIQMVVGLTELFLSRLLFNKEREGYALTLQSRENLTQQSKGGLFPWS